MKNGCRLELIKRIHELNPKIKMLVVSAFQESLYSERCLRAGALGYLNKQESNGKVLDAIRAVIKGQRYVSEELSNRFVEQTLGNRGRGGDPMGLLSDRELEIFKLIGQGVSTIAIASQLFLNTHIIDTHRENIKRKLGAKTGAELNRQEIQSMLENK